MSIIPDIGISLKNPFARLFEDEPKLNPYARIIRSSFWEKVQDTYAVLNGNQQYPLMHANNGKIDDWDIGVLDFWGFYVLRVIIWLFYFIGMSLLIISPVLELPYSYTLGVLFFDVITPTLDALITFIRVVAAIDIMLVILPLIGIVHLIAKIQRDRINKKIDAAVEALAEEGVPPRLLHDECIPHIDKDKYTLYFSTINAHDNQHNLCIVKIPKNAKQDSMKCSYQFFQYIKEQPEPNENIPGAVDNSTSTQYPPAPHSVGTETKDQQTLIDLITALNENEISEFFNAVSKRTAYPIESTNTRKPLFELDQTIAMEKYQTILKRMIGNTYASTNSAEPEEHVFRDLESTDKTDSLSEHHQMTATKRYQIILNEMTKHESSSCQFAIR